VAACTGAFISATLGVTILGLAHLAPWTNFESVWITWWLGDVTGAIIFVPFILVWFAPFKEMRVRRTGAELAFFVFACIVVGEIVFGSYSWLSKANYPIAFLWIPLIAWSGFRFGLKGTTAMTALICPIAILETLHGLGPFSINNSNTSILIAQSFTAVLVITSVSIAAIVGEKYQIENKLRDAHSLAEREIEERTVDLRSLNANLQHAQHELEILSAKLLNAQDQERRRIARELHDSSGQVVALLRIQLDSLRSNPDEFSYLSSAIELTEQLSQEIRTISYLLHPPLLDECGLIPAVRWFVEGFSKRSSIDVDLILDENAGRASLDIETAAFRIVQQCLTNIHQHAKSSTACIVIKESPQGVLLIQVSDRGTGMTKQATLNPGVGIAGMRERVKILGGEFMIQSNPSGTTVTAKFPIGSQSAASV
jgi:signal transduction histidine kinase